MSNGFDESEHTISDAPKEQNGAPMFAILRKGKRTMIVYEPKKKHLRRFEKKKWTLVVTVSNARAEASFIDGMNQMMKAAGVP